MKTLILENSELFKFLVKFLICVGMVYYMVKKKKEKYLRDSFIAAFWTSAIIILLNFLISLTHKFPQERAFYDMVYLDFVFIMLFVNNFFMKDKVKTPPSELNIDSENGKTNSDN
jgi:uncharacterized BrkB/YihY/UPF0761 family membrane protein